MIVQDLVDVISEQTRDTDNVTWTVDDVMQYINEAVKNIIQRAPQANSIKELIDCVAGVDQVLPVNSVYIINVIANDVIDGEAGSIINRVDVQQKDAYSPNWRASEPEEKVIEWMKRSAPTKFLVWPPLDAARKLLVEYSFYPNDVLLAGDLVSVEHEYEEAIIYFCLWKTFSRDEESTPSVQRADRYWVKYEQFFV